MPNIAQTVVKYCIVININIYVSIQLLAKVYTPVAQSIRAFCIGQHLWIELSNEYQNDRVLRGSTKPALEFF